MEDDRCDRAKRFAKIWWKSRADAGVSQEYIALGLGVSKKTIQNWEKGLSSPSLFQGAEWFRVIGKNPLPYYFGFVLPETDNLEPETDDEKLDKALMEIIELLPVEAKRQMLYVLYGKHGSSPFGIMQMIMAHLQAPLRDRLSHATIISQDYEIAKKQGRLTDKEHIQPNMELLEESIKLGYDAIIDDKNGYTV